jgi:hypothetical protein
MIEALLEEAFPMAKMGNETHSVVRSLTTIIVARLQGVGGFVAGGRDEGLEAGV